MLQDACGTKKSWFSTNISLYLGNDTSQKIDSHSYYGRQIGSCTEAFEWYQFQWSWVTWGLKVNGAYCFAVHHMCARALSCCDTRLRTSHQTWPPNRPDLSYVDYRLLSHSGMRLSETAKNIKHRWWAVVINRMTYYISQGRVETPIRRSGQLCCTSVATSLQYLCAKNYQSAMQFDKAIAKIKECNFLPHSVVTLRQCLANGPVNADLDKMTVSGNVSWKTDPLILHDVSWITLSVLRRVIYHVMSHQSSIIFGIKSGDVDWLM